MHKSINDVLHDREKLINHATLNVAEASRPHCAIRESLQPDGSGLGCKQINATIEAVRVNWQTPILWTSIQRAASIVGHGMSPHEITAHAKMIDPISFEKLTPQVVGR